MSSLNRRISWCSIGGGLFFLTSSIVVVVLLALLTDVQVVEAKHLVHRSSTNIDDDENTNNDTHDENTDENIRIINQDEQKESIDYNDCGIGSLRRLNVIGCEPNEEHLHRYCLLTRGTNASLVAKFNPVENFQEASTDVRIKIGFFEFSYNPPIERDACRYYMKCPITKNKLSVVRVTFPIPSLVPSFRTILITARLYGPQGELIVCGQAKAGLI